MDFRNDKDQQYTIHSDETSPHMHVVGLQVVENCTMGWKRKLENHPFRKSCVNLIGLKKIFS